MAMILCMCLQKMKLFNKWEQTGIVIEDQGLKKYININEVIIPKTLGRNAKHRFYRNRCHIVERLMNKLNVPGHKGKKHKLTSRKITGKGFKTYGIELPVYSLISQQYDIYSCRICALHFYPMFLVSLPH